MKVLEIITKLRANPKFKAWRAKNKDAALVHMFIMLDPTQETKYDVGFYDFKKELMTSFVVDEELKTVELNESQEVFKQPGEKIKPLDEKRIKFCFKDACKRCHELQQEKYKLHTPIKEIVILQNLECGQVWNITYIAKTFKTLNFKIDAETGKVIEDKLHDIFTFDK
jgi:hypothetical protein